MKAPASSSRDRRHGWAMLGRYLLLAAFLTGCGAEDEGPAPTPKEAP